MCCPREHRGTPWWVSQGHGPIPGSRSCSLFILNENKESSPINQSLQLHILLPQTNELMLFRLQQPLHALADFSDSSLHFSLLIVKALSEVIDLLEQSLLPGQGVVPGRLFFGL
jgi:hypothetical protein